MHVRPGQRARATAATLAVAILAIGGTSASATGSLLAAPVFYATGTNAHAVSIADMNGDGKNDLVVTNSHNDNVSILLGNGNGGFGAPADFTTSQRPKSAVVADFNGDHKLDVATANQDTATTSVLLGDGHGSLGAKTDFPVCIGAHEITAGDFNGDHKPDLAAACWGGSVVSVLIGNGDGTFKPKTDVESGSATHSLSVADFDGDGHADLAVANHGDATVGVLLGKGDGTFKTVVKYGVGDQPHSVRTGDLDHDGHPDIVSANNGSNTVSVLIGNGNGTFKPSVSYAAGSVPKGVAIADLDSDGNPDILAADTGGNGDGVTGLPGGDVVSILRGTGTGTFGVASQVVVGPTPFSVTTGLLNADSKPDVVTADWDGVGAAVLLNISPTSGGSTPTPTPTPAAKAFTDIAGSPFRADILWLRAHGITAGCAATKFCPGGTVTRGQMASFLARALDLPKATKDYFTDDNHNAHQADINRVAMAGITTGCSAHRFCPNAAVTRAQMASFLARGMHLAAASHDYFRDDDSNSHEADIDRVAKAAITSGCAPRRYCPGEVVTRGQMAAFLHRALE